MKTKLIMALMLLIVAAKGSAQGVLDVEDISRPNDVYSSLADEACVAVRCHKSINLSFASSMDKSADPIRVEEEGSEKIYFLEFHTGNRYRGRILTFIAPGYKNASYIVELSPKQLLTLRLTDPDALVDAGCYREHRNRGMQDLRNTNYFEARAQFVVARQCSDVDEAENEANIQLVDSILYHRQKGDDAYKLLDYLTASEHYTHVIALNGYDNYAASRKAQCLQSYSEECSVMSSRADFYYGEKDYAKAKELYEKVVKMGCQQSVLATQRINEINSLFTARRNHSRVFTYEYRPDTPLGIHYGKYNMKKVGGFIAFDFNKTCFDALQDQCQYGDEKFPEMNIAFGWTVKIASPVWIFFGPGATAKAYYGTYNSDFYPNEDGVADDPTAALDKTDDDWNKKLNIYGTVSPVVGVTLKYSWIALRYTFQYRFSFKKEMEDFMGTQRHSVGIGIAF